MEQKNIKKSGFEIKQLLLVESNFSRINEVHFGDDVKSELNINTDVAVNDNVINVAETVTVKQIFENTEQVNIRVKMVGTFECVGETKLTNFDEFGRINGAAIIFPYIREHITNISAKAGIGLIILPPVNFAQSNNKSNK